MKVNRKNFAKLLLVINFRIRDNHNFIQETIVRLTAALILTTGAVSLAPESLGTNTFIGSLALCTSSILNPGYLHRINSNSDKFRIGKSQAIKEWKTSLSGLLIMFPLMIFLIIDVEVIAKLTSSIGYVAMYATLAFRDIQSARMKRRDIPSQLPSTFYLLEFFLGLLCCLALAVSKQLFLIPLSTVVVSLPMLLKFELNIRGSKFLVPVHIEQKNRGYSSVSLKLAFLGIVSSILMVADNFLVFGLLGLRDLGYYGIAFAIVTLVVNIFGTTLQRNELISNLGTTPHTSSLLLFGTFCLGLLLSLSFLVVGHLYNYQNFISSGLLAIILCTGIPLRIRNLHVSVVIEKFGTFKDRITSLIISISLLSIFSSVGIFVYGLLGLCVASSISYFFIGVVNAHVSRKVSFRLGEIQ